VAFCAAQGKRGDDVRGAFPQEKQRLAASAVRFAAGLGGLRLPAVMRGLDPRIHHLDFTKRMDCRVKPGNDA
jgi:hypothetical protein